ncbi:hypothetical protein [Gemmobacter sp.]|uniref:hypothetical protein n=1 Tax=Gemmobacter sp. TaxID=1898957 RepID=UPI002AFEF0DC|nr:hypothetical protein [Gemmobacter sp.]
MQDSTFIGLDVHKATISVAVAQDERGGEVRHSGTISHRPDHVRKLVEKLVIESRPLCFCYETGPCGYDLHRQLLEMGHDCIVVAPSLIPVKAGDRDAVMLARLHRAGGLTAVSVPGHCLANPACRCRIWPRCNITPEGCGNRRPRQEGESPLSLLACAAATCICTENCIQLYTEGRVTLGPA